VCGDSPLGQPEGKRRGERSALEPLRWRTPITSTRLPAVVGVARISHVLPELKMFESVTVPLRQPGSGKS